MKKIPNPIDKHVGARVRMRRLMLSMSQEKLGDALNLTFQQVQKYEKGTNRIGASRLQQMARILDVPVSFFFDGAPGGDAAASAVAGDRSSVTTAFIQDFLSTREGIEIAGALMRIDNLRLRRRITDLVLELAPA